MAATLRQAVLGLIVERPSYGFELKARLDERMPIWRWNPTGIYDVLDRLEHDEHVRAVGERRAPGASERASPRMVYEATPQGVLTHREWMFRSSREVPVRQELDLKLQLATPDTFPGLIAQTRAREQACMNELAALTRATRPLPGLDGTWAQRSAILQRNAEIKRLEARVESLQEARRELQAFLDGD